MTNRFRLYNKSLLANVFMSRDYRCIWNKLYIPKYNNINKKDEAGWTSLTWACIYEKINITILLLHHKKITNIKDNFGFGALTVVLNNNNTKLLKLLLENSIIDINYYKDLNETALTHAEKCCNEKIINLLKQHSIFGQTLFIS